MNLWRPILSIRKSRKKIHRISFHTVTFELLSSLRRNVTLMLKNYLRVSIRNFAKYKWFSIINTIGLALGMSVSLLLISFYAYVSSFDDFHTKKESIYRIISTLQKGVKRKDLASAPLALASRLQHESAQVKEIVRVRASFRGDVVSSQLNIPIEGLYADANFFSVFDFNMIQGNSLTALSKPRSIVLTELAAKKLSASGDLLGKSIEIDGLGSFEVTGIIQSEKRTHLLFEVLVSLSTLPSTLTGDESNTGEWTAYNDQYLYVLTDPVSGSAGIQQSLDRIANDVYSRSGEGKAAFRLQSLGDITPGPDLDNALGADTDYTLIVVFATICLLILIPACFNYANISIARALKRSKEVGLRKTMGGVNTQIFFQFITETVIITLISLIGAVMIFMLIRPEFEDMMPGSWLDLSLTWEMIVMFLMFAMAVGFLTGIFPALYFARLNPIQALRSQTNSKGISRMQLRKMVSIFQFALSFCFIVSLIIFGRQYRYTLNFDYGFNTENILNVELQGVDPTIFQSEFSRLAEVHDISMSSGVLGLSYSSTQVRQQTSDDSLKVDQLFVDPNYLNNVGLELLAGRNFPDLAGQHILVNEEFLRVWQITNPFDAIGKTFVVDGKPLEIIGVLKNFHYASILSPIKSFLLRTDPSQYKYANVRVASSDIHSTMASMEKVWHQLNDSRKFEARFFDDEMEELYHFYRALLKMLGYLGVLAVSISLLGLLGMVVYTTETRTKEVGIRKVFGATETSITYLLSKDFLKLMLWAVAFAIPASFFLFDDLLSTIQYYRVSLNVWDILTSLIAFLLIGITAIASQTWRAAGKNPIEILRYE
jgi:putative ABC transport system permease protein